MHSDSIPGDEMYDNIVENDRQPRSGSSKELHKLFVAGGCGESIECNTYRHLRRTAVTITEVNIFKSKVLHHLMDFEMCKTGINQILYSYKLRI